MILLLLEDEGDDDEGDEGDEGDDVSEHFSNEVCELVALGKVSRTGANEMLRIVARRYARYLPPHISFPGSFYMVRKQTMSNHDVAHVIRHLCTKCDFMFPEAAAPSEEMCPVCREATRWAPGVHRKPGRIAVYFTLADTIARKFSSKVMFDSLIEFANNPRAPHRQSVRDRQLADAWDGVILDGRARAGLETVTLYVALTCDAVEVFSNKSYTPVTMKILNLKGHNATI